MKPFRLIPTGVIGNTPLHFKKKFLQRKKNNPGVPTTQFALLFQHKTKSEMGDNKIEGRLHYLFIHSNLDITNLDIVNFAI